MIAKRAYLFSPATFILIVIGAGFAIHDRQSRMQTTLQTLETATLQIHQTHHKLSGHETKAYQLLEKAIAEVKADIDSKQ